MKKRELKRSIVLMIRNRQVYGYDLQKLLAAQGAPIQLSYLYKILKEMSQEGLLESKLIPGKKGPQRRSYHLTRSGKKELGRVFGEATELIHDLYEDYILSLPPKYFSDRFSKMMKEVYGNRETAALLISEPLSPVHRAYLEAIAGRDGAKKTYLIKSGTIRSDVDLPNLTVLDGTFEDIPLKDNSLDAMIVVDIQDAVNLRGSCKEFRRVLKPGAVMCGCAAFMGLGGKNDPLDVGEFMKKTKYALMARPYVDKESIKTAFSDTFDYCDIANMSLITVFLAGLKPIVLSSPTAARRSPNRTSSATAKASW